MKRAKWVAVVMLVVLSGLAAAQTIGSTRIAASVPFEFMVANKVVPAGDYVVQAGTADALALMISNTDAKVSLFSMSSQTEQKDRASHYALLFKRYGNQYFLSGVRIEGSNITYQLPESRAEAELRAEKVPATTETLLASLK